MLKFELRIEVRQYPAGRKPDDPAATTCWTKPLTAKDAQDAQEQAIAEVENTVVEYEGTADTNTKWFEVKGILQPAPIWEMSINAPPQRASKS